MRCDVLSGREKGEAEQEEGGGGDRSPQLRGEQRERGEDRFASVYSTVRYGRYGTVSFFLQG